MNRLRQQTLTFLSARIALTGIILLLFLPMLSAQDIKEGESLFRSKCTACHSIDRDMIGPRLEGIEQKRDQQWLIDWIRNSQAMVAAGDEHAVAMFESYDRVVMTPFPELSDENILNILAYIKHETETAKPAAVVPGTERPLNETSTAPFMTWITGIFAVLILFALLAIILLGKIIKTLEKHLISKNFKQKAVAREDLPTPISTQDHLRG